MSEIEALIHKLDETSSIEEEIAFIKKSLPELFKPRSQLEKKLNDLGIIFNKYRKDFKAFIIFLDAPSKVLKLPREVFREYIYSDSDIYTRELSSSLINLSKNEFESLNYDDLESLKNFFTLVAKNANFIIFADSIEEDDLNIQYERINQYKENDEATLDLIQKQPNLWYFLDIIKNPMTSLKSYFNKITELIHLKKYSNILEAITKWNYKVTVLNQFNYSIYDPENEKSYKINSILSDSELKIKRKMFTQLSSLLKIKKL